MDLETVAHAVGMSYHTFRERFRERAGIPPGRYRMQERVEVARRMLERDELTARAISNALGFGGEANFSRRFQQLVGVSPRRYRQQRRLEKKDIAEQKLEADEADGTEDREA